MLLGRPSVLISLLLAQFARRSSEYASECSSSSAYTHGILTPGSLGWLLEAGPRDRPVGRTLLRTCFELACMRGWV